MRSEYKREDLGVGVRGKYYEEYQASHNVVLLKPEVAKAFPTDEAVNDALMALIKIAKTSISQAKNRGNAQTVAKSQLTKHSS